MLLAQGLEVVNSVEDGLVPVPLPAQDSVWPSISIKVMYRGSKTQGTIWFSDKFLLFSNRKKRGYVALKCRCCLEMPLPITGPRAPVTRS